jgi:hypothetical protein
MKRYGGLLAILSILLTGCLPVRPNFNPPQITQLQARAIQTRSYDGLDQKTVLKTVLNVLQDEGFIVHYGDVELGLLNASKELVENTKTDFASQFMASLGNANALRNAVSSIEATANISEFGKQIKVRMNFQRKVGNDQLPVDVSQINDPKFYQEFFVKVDKGLFIQKQGL